MINFAPGQSEALVAGMTNAAPPPGPMPSPMGPPPGAPPPGMNAPPMPGEPMPPAPPGAVINAPNGQPAPKKPPLLVPPDMAKELAQGYVDQANAMAKRMADFTGPPSEYERMKLKEQASAWNKRDPRQDPLALRDQGLSPKEIRDKVYPLRRILLKLAGPRPTDRVKFAARMKAELSKMEYDSGNDSFLS